MAEVARTLHFATLLPQPLPDTPPTVIVASTLRHNSLHKVQDHGSPAEERNR